MVTSYWSCVLGDVPQVSILGRLLFIIYSNDLHDSCGDDANLILFADDAKMFPHFHNSINVSTLQCKSDKFIKWTNKWLVKLIVGKCTIMSVCH